MIVTITPNLAWDLTYTVDRLTPGASHRVRTVHGRAGGKGVNVARVLHHLGEATHVLAPAGGDRGADCAADLSAARIASTLVPISGTTRQSVAVLPEHAGNDAGHPSVFNEPGPEVTTREWDALVETAGRLAAAADTTAVTISGSLPPGVGRAEFEALLRALAGPVLVDVSGPAIVWAAESAVALVKPNRTELAEALGTDDVGTAARRLLDAGAGSVVVTDGSAGLRAYDRSSPGEVWHAVLDEPVQGNPTGAGDAAMAALAAGVALPWPQRLRKAAAVSAAAVAEPVAGDVDPALVARLARHVVLRP